MSSQTSEYPIQALHGSHEEATLYHFRDGKYTTYTLPVISRSRDRDGVDLDSRARQAARVLPRGTSGLDVVVVAKSADSFARRVAPTATSAQNFVLKALDSGMNVVIAGIHIIAG